QLPLPKSKSKCSSAFSKFSLTGDDWAIINCAASIELDNHGRIALANIVFGGGVGEKPVIASMTQAGLHGTDGMDESTIRQIFETNLPNELEPISDIRSSANYRIRLAKVLGRRTVMTACSRILFETETG